MHHAHGPRKIHRLLPGFLYRKESGPVEVPDGIVAEDVAKPTAKDRPVRLPPDLHVGRVMLTLVGRFDQDEWFSRISAVGAVELWMNQLIGIEIHS